MEKLEQKLHNNIPSIEFLEERFLFVANKTLRTNLAISLQYLIFLITIEEEITLPGPTSYSLLKTLFYTQLL
jgi:hypothetical protein